MDPRLLNLYEQELRYFRESSSEFARAFPKIAHRLGIEGQEVADPYVERLIEATAFLSARVNLKLDAEPVRDLRERARELGRAFAEVAKLLLVQVQQPGVHAEALPVGHVLDLDASFFQVDPAAHEELQRHGLRPQHAADLQADAVVRVEGGAIHDEFHFESA